MSWKFIAQRDWHHGPLQEAARASGHAKDRGFWGHGHPKEGCPGKVLACRPPDSIWRLQTPVRLLQQSIAHVMWSMTFCSSSIWKKNFNFTRVFINRFYNEFTFNIKLCTISVVLFVKSIIVLFAKSILWLVFVVSDSIFRFNLAKTTS